MAKISSNIRAGDFLAFTAALAIVAGAFAIPGAAQQGVDPAPSLTPGVASPTAKLDAALAAGGGDKAAQVPDIPVPPEVLQAITAKDNKDDGLVRKFLLGGRMESVAVTNRALALVRAVRVSAAGQDPQRFLEISTRVSEIAKRIFEASAITRVVVDKTYHPGPNAKAWKFGPPDAEAPPGFEKVTPDDPRLRGVNMRGIHRPGRDPLTSSGIAGVRNFNSALNNGEWRVILLTDDTGDPKLSDQPFGQQVHINNAQLELLEADPNQWLERAYLTNRNIKAPAASSGAPAAIELQDGVVTHQAAGGGNQLADNDVASTNAGALMMRTQVQDSQINVGFVPPANQSRDTYVVGLIAEPATQPPALKQQVTSLEIEGKIFSQAIQLTEAPKAGQPITATQPGALGPQGPQVPTPSSQTLDVVAPPNTPAASPT
jgi:hypothetical protein